MAFRPWNKSQKRSGFSRGPFRLPKTTLDRRSPRRFRPQQTDVIFHLTRFRTNLAHVALPPQEIRTFFITTVAAQRCRLFQTDANATLLLNLLNDDRAKGRYQLHAFVLMPDHLHLLLTPAADVSVEKAMQFIKGGFSFRLKSKMPVWEKSFTLRRIEDPRDYETHRNYIHANPVEAHLCERPEDFAWSSANPTAIVDPSPPHLRA
jgi:putative transposase